MDPPGRASETYETFTLLTGAFLLLIELFSRVDSAAAAPNFACRAGVLSQASGESLITVRLGMQVVIPDVRVSDGGVLISHQLT